MHIAIILIALIAGSIGSVALAGSLLLLDDEKLQKTSSYLLSLAGGTLLGSAFLGMLPEAVKTIDANVIFKLILAGIILFFLIEKVILWRSCGNKNCERHNTASAQLIIIGDAFHNFVDGIIITAAFLASPTFGLFVTLSVIAHEIPQELADFGILIKNGFSKRKALSYNMLSGSTAIIGGLVALFALESAQKLIPFVLVFSASSFIYIALADLVPSMHNKTKLKDSLIQFILILIGILIIYLIKQR